MEHTPGPWEIVDDGITNVIVTKKGKDNIAMVFHGREVDARLIVAAPEMLEMLLELIMIIRIHSRKTNNNFAWAEMDSAIDEVERATGKKIEDILKEDR
jgi:hypothetical protein